MKIDIKALDEKIRKLQMIRQLAADPALSPLLQEVIIGNGSTPSVRQGKPKLQGVRRDVFKNTPEGEEGATTAQIAETMKAAGYRFKSKNPKLTVKEQLRELEKMGLAEKVGINEDGAAIWRRK